MAPFDNLNGAAGAALAIALVVGLPALVLVALGLWHPWVRKHFWASFAIACALTVAIEAFTLFAVCSGTKW